MAIAVNVYTGTTKNMVNNTERQDGREQKDEVFFLHFFVHSMSSIPRVNAASPLQANRLCRRGTDHMYASSTIIYNESRSTYSETFRITTTKTWKNYTEISQHASGVHCGKGRDKRTTTFTPRISRTVGRGEIITPPIHLPGS